MIRLADYVMERLYAAGIDKIFTVTGRGILYLTDAAARKRGLDCICVHHEQTASFAAMAYAQSSGGLGACLVSTGCAATNAVTGALCAWQDQIPCVFISGQHILKETVRYTGIPLRTYGSQETDIIAMTESITKYAVMITDPLKIGYELDKALYFANSGRKGPVWIDIPLDIQDMRIEPDSLSHFFPENKQWFEASPQDVDYVVEAFHKAERPAILIGSGVRSAEAIESLEKFIEQNHVPLTYSSSAADIYGGLHAMSMGAVGGMAGSRAGNFVVQNSDLLLVIGCRLSSMLTGPEFSSFARAATVIVVDIDSVEHTKNNIKIDKLVIADAKSFLDKMLQQTIGAEYSNWTAKCSHWKELFAISEKDFVPEGRVDLYYLAYHLSSCIDKDAAVITDAGLEELIIPSAMSFGKMQRCLHPAAQGAMGYALPAILGAYYAGLKSLTAVIGDGSVMMNLQELQTISYAGIPVKILIINNNMYAVIRKRQKDLFRTRTVGTDRSNGVGTPDFKKIAACFGFDYTKIHDNDELKRELQNVLKREGSVICEIMCLEDQPYLHCSYALTERRKLVRRPMEDLSPFIDRDLFKQEMIIDPLDE